MRSVLIEQKLLARKGIRISDAEINQHKKEFEKILKQLYPCLKGQSVAVISMSELPLSDGLILEAFLVELPQLSFPFSTSRSPAIKNFQNDPFQQLAQKLEFEKESVETDLLQATDIVSVGEKIISGENLDNKGIVLRKIIKNSGRWGLHSINGIDLRSHRLPATFSICEISTINARVRAIEANRAFLFDVEEELSDERTSHRQIPHRVQLKRPRDEHFSEYGGILLNAIDGGKRIRAKVNICLDVVAFQVEYLELLQII